VNTAPLILTLELDDKSFRFFNALRQQHFPPERNFLAAHLTLFHDLPPNEPRIKEEIQQLAAMQNELLLQVTSVVSTGAGVAYKIESDGLKQLHKSLQKAWAAWLIPQDKQTLWPHVTVQNKVTAQQAKELHSKLAEGFVPFAAYGNGLRLWEYLGGPWKHVETFLFTQN
jgi:hypothetical protein